MPLRGQARHLRDRCKIALSEVVYDARLVGILGKAVLASQLAFLLANDKDWINQYLVPLFGLAMMSTSVRLFGTAFSMET